MSKITNQATVTAEFSTASSPTQKATFVSNLYSIEYLTESFHKTRTSTQHIAHPSDIITFDLELFNTSDLPLTGISMLDTLDDNLEFVPQSLTIDAVPRIEADPTKNLFIIDLLPPMQKVLVSYKARINSNPTSNFAVSDSRITFSVDRGQKLSEFSNTTKIPIIKSHSNITINKTADKTTATSGDKIKFTNTIISKNISSMSSAYFVEKLPHGTRFVPKTVTINGEVMDTLNPKEGFEVSDLQKNNTTIIEYDIEVL